MEGKGSSSRANILASMQVELEAKEAEWAARDAEVVAAVEDRQAATSADVRAQIDGAQAVLDDPTKYAEGFAHWQATGKRELFLPEEN